MTSLASVNFFCSDFGLQDALPSIKLQFGLLLPRLCFFAWINLEPYSNPEVPSLSLGRTVLDIHLLDLEFINKFTHLKRGEGKP